MLSILNLKRAPHNDRIELNIDVDIENNRMAALDGDITLPARPAERIVLRQTEIQALAVPRVDV